MCSVGESVFHVKYFNIDLTAVTERGQVMRGRVIGVKRVVNCVLYEYRTALIFPPALSTQLLLLQATLDKRLIQWFVFLTTAVLIFFYSRMFQD